MFIHGQLFFLFVVLKLRTIYCKMEGFVVDGDGAKIDDFPHSVYLHVRCRGTWICGASILNQRILLTAAHCVYDPHKKSHCEVRDRNVKIQSYIGHEDLRKVTITRGATDLIVHSEFDDYKVENDIALVYLNDTIPLSETAKRVVISEQWSLQDLNGIVAGWGILNETTQATAKTLMSVNQEIRSHQICEVVGEVHPGMFCAGSTFDDDPHAASGDSGSALITNNVHQIGIVSFRVNSYHALMVYSNVTYYYTWITQTSAQLYCRNQ